MTEPAVADPQAAAHVSETTAARVPASSDEGLAAATGRRNEWLLVSFAATTNVADAVTRVTLPLLTLLITRSPVAITAVTATLSLPWLVTALHIGVLVDRLNRRTLLIAAEVARLASVGILVAAYLSDQLSLPLILLTAAVFGVADVVAGIASTSIVPAAVPRRRWQQAVARITGVEYLCSGFVGAPLGGFLVAAGFGIALYSAGAAYLAGAALLLLLAGDFAVRKDASERGPMRLEITEGLQFLWRSTLLRTMALLITVMAGCWAAWLALIPVYAVGGPLGLSPQQYGVLLTCLGAGGVVGALAVGRTNALLGRRWSMFVDIVGTFVLVATPTLLPAEPTSAVPIGVAAFVAGAGGTMWTVNSRVIVQTLVPDELLGRFIAASRMVAWGMTPVAAIVGGILAEVFSFRVAFGVFAVLCLVLVYPFLRVITPGAIDEMERRLERGSEEVVA